MNLYSSQDLVDKTKIWPEELHLKILSYLDVKSLSHAIRVSKSWHKIGLDPEIWQAHFALYKPDLPKCITSRLVGINILTPVVYLNEQQQTTIAPSNWEIREAMHHELNAKGIITITNETNNNPYHNTRKFHKEVNIMASNVVTLISTYIEMKRRWKIKIVSYLALGVFFGFDVITLIKDRKKLRLLYIIVETNMLFLSMTLSLFCFVKSKLAKTEESAVSIQGENLLKSNFSRFIKPNILNRLIQVIHEIQ